MKKMKNMTMRLNAKVGDYVYVRQLQQFHKGTLLDVGIDKNGQEYVLLKNENGKSYKVFNAITVEKINYEPFKSRKVFSLREDGEERGEYFDTIEEAIKHLKELFEINGYYNYKGFISDHNFDLIEVWKFD